MRMRRRRRFGQILMPLLSQNNTERQMNGVVVGWRRNVRLLLYDFFLINWIGVCATMWLKPGAVQVRISVAGDRVCERHRCDV